MKILVTGASIDASGCIGKDHLLTSQKPQHPNGPGNFLQRVSLIIMEPPLHGCDIFSFQSAEHQLSLVSRRCGDRKMGDRSGLSHVSSRR